jgi:hypothetical protein
MKLNPQYGHICYGTLLDDIKEQAKLNNYKLFLSLKDIDDDRKHQKQLKDGTGKL